MERELTLEAVVSGEAGDVNEPVELGRLFDRCHRRLFALARRMSHDAEESQDLVQDAFLRAARRIASVPRADADAEAWLVRVLVNLCKDRNRRLVVRRRHAREATQVTRTPGAESAEEQRRRPGCIGGRRLT